MATATIKNSTEFTGPTSLVIRRTFAAARERVWSAWTDSKQMMQWAGPRGFTISDYHSDPRVGGTYRMVMVAPDGEAMPVRGTYTIIEPPARLAYTWCWEEDTPEEEHDTQVTIEFKDLGDGTTELVLTHELLRNQESRDNHGGGWGEMLDGLGEFLAA